MWDMLTALNVENFGLIHHADVTFDKGFTAVTGESGAGKSLLLTAIPAVFGLSGTADQVGPFGNSFRIRAAFSVSPADLLWNVLRQWGIEEDDTLIIQRDMTAEGRSTYRVQGQIVTRQVLRELAPELIDFSGQHHALRLFDSSPLLLWLDHYAQLEPLRSQVETAYHAWRKQKAAHAELTANVPDAHIIASKRQEVEELLQLHLDAEEEERLSRELTRLHSRQRLLEILHTIEQDLDNAESGNVVSLLGRIARNVENLMRLDADAMSLGSLVDQTISVVDELRLALNEWASHLDQEPGQLEALESRANELAKVKRRYNMGIDELVRYTETLQQDLEKWENFEWELHIAERKLRDAESEYMHRAEELSKQRRVAAEDVSGKLSELVHEMEMPASQVRFVLETNEPAQWGLDHAAIFYASSAQQDMKPATKVASGGELARLALAMAVLGGSHGGATLIFDELDAGLGGQSAARVGRLLRSLGEHRQVIVISHQPSVAANAHSQWIVVKTPDENGVRSIVKCVENHDREQEIARMLSGQSDAMATSHARHLLEWGKRGD
ncbi:MAG: hypothetical protein C7B47_02485 [Sulfobacillus thermosulfidooxidans]|nr:MAG: hypothetical protein C7B47_02485 [Sulfobacillus thermosulfidooxidans]